MKNKFFTHENMKKPPQKVAYLSRNSVVSEIFHLLPNECPTAQMTEFMFQNVVYRATVYRTGILGLRQVREQEPYYVYGAFKYYVRK